MVAANFDKAFAFCLIDEKGNDDDPLDRGGRTSDGITQREYDAWCDLHKSPRGDVWLASMDTKKAIYYAQYWMPVCNNLPTGIDYLFFDTNVNSGYHEAALILQRCLNVAVDGHVGVITVAAALSWPDKRALVDAFCAEHDRVYHLIVQAHPTDQRFMRGWENRIAHEKANAYAMLAPT